MAAPRALLLATEHAQQARNVALKTGWRPNIALDNQETEQDEIPEFRTELPARFWSPDFKFVKQSPNAHLIIGTDASLSQQGGGAAISAVATGGMGMVKALEPQHISELELNAITLGVRLAKESGAASATILSDNRCAAAAADAVLAGLQPKAGFRGISGEALAELAAEIKDGNMKIQIVKIKGHSGNLLNEIADRVAVFARIASQYPRDLVGLELHLRVAALWASTINITEVSFLEDTREPVVAEQRDSALINNEVVKSALAQKTRLTYSIGDMLKEKGLSMLMSIVA